MSKELKDARTPSRVLFSYVQNRRMRGGDVDLKNYELAEQDYMAGMKYKEIAEKYEFSYRNADQMDDSVLYAEPSLQGNAVMARRKSGSPETPINLELLFNAAILGKLDRAEV